MTLRLQHTVFVHFFAVDLHGYNLKLYLVLWRTVVCATKCSCCCSNEIPLLCFSSLVLAVALSLSFLVSLRHKNLIGKETQLCRYCSCCFSV